MMLNKCHISRVHNFFWCSWLLFLSSSSSTSSSQLLHTNSIRTVVSFLLTTTTLIAALTDEDSRNHVKAKNNEAFDTDDVKRTSPSIIDQLISSDDTFFQNQERSTKQHDATTSGGIIWRDLAVVVGSSSWSSSSSSSTSSSSSDDGNDNDNNDQNYYIVHPFSGVLQNGQVCGIIGPSGAGKTSFLSAIAGFIPIQPNGNVWIYHSHSHQKQQEHNNNNNKNQLVITFNPILSNQIAWIRQHDDFFNQLSVFETLYLASFLELPHLSNTDRCKLIQKTIESLSIQHITHRIIGDYNDKIVTTTKIPRNAGRRKNRNNSKKSITSRSMKGSAPCFGQGNTTTTGHNDSRRNSGDGGGRLSGGERRRLSIALELLTDKPILFIADEPTSGLDSRMSKNVMDIIRKQARERNIPAFCSLHQPMSSIWHELDSIILLAPGGKVCYCGPREAVPKYFQNLGYPLPTDMNPSEFLIDLVSIDSEDPNKAILDYERIDILAKAFSTNQIQQWNTSTTSINRKLLRTRPSTKSGQEQEKDEFVIVPSFNNYPISSTTRTSKLIPHSGIVDWFRRVGALFRRSWRQNTRDMQLNIFRIGSHIVNGVLLSNIFPTVRGPIPYVSSVADRVALLSFASINLGMMSYMKSVSLFASEKPVIHREQRKEQYTPLQYLIAKVLAEIPLDCLFSLTCSTVLKQCSGLMIGWKQLSTVLAALTTAAASLGFLIGSIAPTPEFANNAGIPLIVILMVVGVINPSGVDPSKPKPLAVRCMKLFSPFAYSIEALCLGEYPGVIFQVEQTNTNVNDRNFQRRRQQVGSWFHRMKNAPRMGGLAFINNGDQVIEALGLNKQTFVGALQKLGWITAGNLIASWILLQWEKRKNGRVSAEVQTTASMAKSVIAADSDGSFITDSSSQRFLMEVPPRIVKYWL